MTFTIFLSYQKKAKNFNKQNLKLMFKKYDYIKIQ